MKNNFQETHWAYGGVATPRQGGGVKILRQGGGIKTLGQGGGVRTYSKDVYAVLGREAEAERLLANELNDLQILIIFIKHDHL